MDCRLFLTGGYLTEMDHLRALILQLLHMEESIWRSWSSLGGGAGSAICLLSGDIAVGWESSASEMWTSDRVGRRLIGSTVSIIFTAFLGHSLVALFLDGAILVMLGSFKGRSRVF